MTPLPGAVDMAEQLVNGVLLTWAGSGHTAYPKTGCVTDAVNAYLIDLTAPADGRPAPSDDVPGGAPMSGLAGHGRPARRPGPGSPGWSASTAAGSGARQGVRAGAPRLGAATTVDTRFGDRERHQGADRADRREPDRGRRARADTTARSVLGDDLPLIDDGVTVEHLLAHRSGIGDYIDEDGRRANHRLRAAGAGAPAGDTEDYLAVLDGHPQSSRRASGSPTTTAASSSSR